MEELKTEIIVRAERDKKTGKGKEKGHGIKTSFGNKLQREFKETLRIL